MTLEKKNRIVIHGGCISYRQLYYLLQTIKKRNPEIKKLNERVANRALKIN